MLVHTVRFLMNCLVLLAETMVLAHRGFPMLTQFLNYKINAITFILFFLIWKHIFFSKYTQWQNILSFDNSTAMYKDLKTSHHGGIRTWDLLFWRRTRWQQFRPARANAITFWVWLTDLNEAWVSFIRWGLVDATKMSKKCPTRLDEFQSC
jgi:hypothetical protein